MGITERRDRDELARLLRAAGREDLAAELEGGFLDAGDVRVVESACVEKFDHSGDMPRLFERLTTEEGQMISRETFPEEA